MNRIILSALFLTLAFSANAQSTNITSVRVTAVTNGVTEQISINLSQKQIDGFLMALSLEYQKAAAETNPPPTLNAATKNIVDDLLLKVLAAQAGANEQKTNKTKLLWQYGSLMWDNDIFTGPQKTDIKALLNSANVSNYLATVAQ